MTAEILTQQVLRELVYYHPQTGAFYWRERPLKFFKEASHQQVWNKRLAGTLAGCINPRGYWRFCIFGKQYTAHRLAWLYVYGEWPSMALDHINHDKTDNRIENLRQVTAMESSQNIPCSTRNKSGTVGVCWNKAQREWFAYISINRKQVFLGNFKNLDDAIQARVAAQKRNGYHPNHGNYSKVAP